MKRKLLVLALAITLVVLAVSGSEWDNYVFIESSRMLCMGVDPYKYFDSVRAYIPSLGPMSIAYSPLMLLLWSPLICTLVKLGLQYPSLPYLWAVKAVPAMFSFLSVLILKKFYKKSAVVALLPIVIVAIYLHGMFDSVTAFFLLLTTALLRKNKDCLAGFSYGLAIASKQHALLALLPLTAFYLRKKSLSKLAKFTFFTLLSMMLVIVLFGALIGNVSEGFKDVIEVMTFHLERPPNGLGFGGFSVISFYSDAMNGYSGNIISATVFRGKASTLHGPITEASLPFLLPSIVLASLIEELEVAIALSYSSYILFSYVGALQHLAVPAFFVPFMSKKGRKLFIVSTSLYALSHVLAFWSIYPIIFEPLFLKIFDLSEIKLSRITDIVLPSWDVALRLFGMVLTSIALVTLILFVAVEFSRRLNFPLVKVLIPLAYVLELIILAIALSSLSFAPEHVILKGENLVAVYAWENIEYPGYRFGDYLTTPEAVPRLGYYSLVLPLAEKLASKFKQENVEALVVAKIDTLRSYQATDLVGALIRKGVKWAWLVILSKNDSYYLEGLTSAPLYQIGELFFIISHNIPLKGYATLPPVLEALNVTLIKLPPIEYPYPLCNDKPLVYLLPLGLDKATIIKVEKVATRYGLCVKVIKRVNVWNANLRALST